MLAVCWVLSHTLRLNFHLIEFPKQLCELVPLMYPFCRWGNWGTERLNILSNDRRVSHPKATVLGGGGIGHRWLTCGSCHYGIRCCVEVSSIQQSFRQWWNDHCFRSLRLQPPWGMKSGRIWTKMVWSCSLHFWPMWTGYAVSRCKPGDFREVSCCKEMIKVKINIM